MAAAQGPSKGVDMENLSRRKLLASAGVATGAAAIAAAPSVAQAALAHPEATDPPGGPNFFEFGDDVRYSIYVDNDGDGKPEIEYQFRFKTKLRHPDTFLYNTGQITALNSQTWNRRQFYEVTKVNHKRGKSKVLG